MARFFGEKDEAPSSKGDGAPKACGDYSITVGEVPVERLRVREHAVARGPGPVAAQERDVGGDREPDDDQTLLLMALA